MSKIWRSGDWQIDLRDDEFADIKFQNQIVLRSVRAVIRDRDWNTAQLVIDSFTESENELKFAVHSDGFGAEFTGEIYAKVDGQVATFTMDLTALSDYQTNRTGLIVLHSPDVSGAPLEVTHTNGEAEALKFPLSISPNQPVFDIAALSWQHNALQIDVAFAGDIFEMEDQRNWSDASYKTYNRPLSKPFPYQVSTGEKILQIIKIHVQPTGEAKEKTLENKIQLIKLGKFPQTQVTASTAPDVQAEQLNKDGNPRNHEAIADVVLVELDLASSNWQAALNRAAASSQKLDVRFIVLEHADLQKGIEAICKLPNEIVRVGAFDSGNHVSPSSLTNLLRDLAKKFDLGAAIVSGARSHFTELNREQSQILPGSTEITYASTPLFHSLRSDRNSRSG